MSTMSTKTSNIISTGTLNQYIELLERVYGTCQGNILAQLLSLRDVHVMNRNLRSSDIVSLVEGNCMAPLAEIVISHLLCVQALHVKDYMAAYEHQSTCVTVVVRVLQAQREENWSLPLMYSVCLDLRLVAQKADLTSKSNGKILEKAAESLLACFRICAADNRSSDQDTKKVGMLNLVNQLFKVYFRINKLHLCKPLIRAIDSSPFKDQFPLAQRITYQYFVGRKAMLDSDYNAANEFLTFAFNHCHKNSIRNKKLILTCLIPVKMLLGYMPNKHVLHKYGLQQQFTELISAVKAGNLRGIDTVMDEYETFFIKTGVYLTVEKLKITAYRNLFRKVYLAEKSHQIPIASFQAALQLMGHDDVDAAETQCLVANLIYHGKMKGYISYQHQKVVVCKQNAFPPLTTYIKDLN